MLRTLAVLLLVAPLASGCVAVAAAGVCVGFGVVQYARNEVAQDFPAPLEVAWQASQEGLQRLQLVPGESALTGTEGVLVSGDVRVLVERHPEGFTRVRVRAGTFHAAGNERRARVLLAEIAAILESQDELRAWVEQSTPPPPAPRAN